MKLEQSEKFFVSGLFNSSVKRQKAEECLVLDINRLAGDASTRRYYRVETTRKSYVVCLDNPIPSGNSSSFIEVHKVLLENGVQIPQLYDFDPHHGYFLEEDLGDITFLQRAGQINSKEEELSLYQQCIEQLIKIHRIKPERYPDSCFRHLAFDHKKLMQEVDFSLKFFCDHFLQSEIGPKEREVIRSTFDNICQKIEHETRVFTHRDYHSRNIMVRGSEISVIDFQDAMMGIPQYDLVSLLDDCYYELNQSNHQYLKDFYWENFLKNSGHQESLDEFNYLYDLMAIQRTLKAIGSFSYIVTLRNDLRYIKYIGYSFEKLKRFLIKYPKFNSARKVIAGLYYAH
jgi:N-acetylmuramate 1-kinase